MDETAALRPLIEVVEDLHRLEHYDTSDDLAAAITAVADALERVLRLRLRSDRGAPEAHRVTALSRDLLPYDEVVRSLRTRDLISLEAAGTLHEARAAAERAGAGDARPADADVVRTAVARLRQELAPDAPTRSVASDAAEPAAEPAIGGPSAADASPGASAVPPASDARWMRWIAAAFAAAVLVGVAWVAIRGSGEEYEDAVAAFRAGRLDSAAVGFERVLEDRPDDVTVMLYLARSYRRLDRPEEAAALLRRAVDRESEDGDVRRELGHLFMELDRPAPAVEQYERALEYDPDNPRNWAALIRALRTVEDPRAEQLLRDAPAEVQAAMSGA